MKTETALVLLSGGLDSTVLLHWCRTKYKYTEAVFFNYGSRQNPRELEVVQQLCRDLGVKLIVVNLEFFKQNFMSSLLQNVEMTRESTVVPYRNGILLSIAAGIACSSGLDVVCIANHYSDNETYPDCRSEFIDSQTEAIETGTGGKVTVSSPFCNFTKDEVVKIGICLGVDFSKTWSCYNGGKVHCGRCPTCLERAKAFKKANIIDPTEYEEQPYV